MKKHGPVNPLDIAAERARRAKGLPAGTAPIIDPVDPHPLIAAAHFEPMPPEAVGDVAREALAGAGVGLWDLNPQESVIRVDPLAMQLLGATTPEGVRDAPTHRDDAPPVRAAFRALFNGEVREATSDIRIRLPSGGWRWARIRARLHPDGTRVTGTVQDVQAEHEQRAAPEARRAFLQSIYDGVQEAIFVVNLGPDGALRFESMNRFMADRLGLDDEDISGHQPHEIAGLSRSAAQRLDASCRSCLHHEVAVEYEYVETVNGEDTWWTTRLARLKGSADENVRVIGSMSDTTAGHTEETRRVELERNLQEAMRLESLGALAGGVAHDFNNLLTAILGTAELVRTELDDPTQARADLDLIERAARDAAVLCRELLAYSGRGRFLPETIDPGQFLREREAEIIATIGDNQELILTVPQNAVSVVADVTQLAQVVESLVRNASEAMQESGLGQTIALRAERCSLTVAERQAWGLPPNTALGSYAVLEVTDDGPGINAEDRARIFEPFFSTRSVGRGLGLATVMGIIRSHDGAVGVTSTEGDGTSIRVLLPAVDPKPLSVAPTRAPVQTERPRMLLVDDAPLVRRTAGRIFRRMGFEVVEAANADASLPLFAERGPWTLVVADLSTARGNSVDLVAELHALDPDIRTILTSGYDSSDAVKRARQCGADAYLPKPFHGAEARAAVARALGPDWATSLPPAPTPSP
jgi:two-component system, cell cycle sensor histidine kinase and response regulator CckA